MWAKTKFQKNLNDHIVCVSDRGDRKPVPVPIVLTWINAYAFDVDLEQGAPQRCGYRFEDVAQGKKDIEAWLQAEQAEEADKAEKKRHQVPGMPAGFHIDTGIGNALETMRLKEVLMGVAYPNPKAKHMPPPSLKSIMRGANGETVRAEEPRIEEKKRGATRMKPTDILEKKPL